MVEFNPDVARTETVTIRNVRSTYPNDKKPNVDTVLQEALSGGYARMETSTYFAYGNEENLPSIIETYYNADGSVVATRTTQNGLPSEGTQAVHIDTPTATYHDWDNDGQVDSKDTDRTVTRKVQEESTEALEANEKPSLWESFRQTTQPQLRPYDVFPRES